MAFQCHGSAVSCVYNRSLKREVAGYRSWRTQSKWRRLMEIVETNASESSARVGRKSKTLLPLCEWHLKSVGAGQKRTEMEVKKKQYFQRVKDELTQGKLCSTVTQRVKDELNQGKLCSTVTQSERRTYSRETLFHRHTESERRTYSRETLFHSHTESERRTYSRETLFTVTQRVKDELNQGKLCSTVTQRVKDELTQGKLCSQSHRE